ncbi:hypothetical protein [Sphingobium sp. HWE2-09]|uniref:hypothetical protein n=1 Tax=Sphingobium sp. HWE2-09 TaxID=3108390 RepID=UPI002DCD88C2|nr:hypothetical protein [Sphingobium sp. HWE2-09]
MAAEVARPSALPGGRILLTAGAGGAAALVVAAGFAAARGPALAAVGMIALGGALWASGNPQLACLWGVGLTAPLGVAKRFHPMPHMGGAGAYSIEAVDLFLLALFLFQWRDRARGRAHCPCPPWRCAGWR